MSVKRIIGAAFLLVAIACCTLYLAGPLLSAKFVGYHQQSTTAELKRWAEEYSTIEDGNEAGSALGMLEYIPRYYVVAPGYRSDAVTEQRLETQRDTTMRAISAALDKYIAFEGGSRGESLRAAKAKALTGTRWEENHVENKLNHESNESHE